MHVALNTINNVALASSYVTTLNIVFTVTNSLCLAQYYIV